MSYPPPGPPHFPQPPAGHPPVAPVAPPRKSKARLIVFAVVLPLGLLVLFGAAVVGIVAYTSIQEEKRIEAVASVADSLGAPTGFQSSRTKSDFAFDTKYVTVCNKGGCPSVNPVKQTFNWLAATGFTPTSEQYVGLCYQNGCSLTTSKYTPVGYVDLSARLILLDSNSRYTIDLHGKLRD